MESNTSQIDINNGVSTETSAPVAPVNYGNGGETNISGKFSLDTEKWNWFVTIGLAVATAFSIYTNRKILSKL